MKSIYKATKASQVWESEETSQVESSDDDSNDKEMAFIIKRF